MVQTLSTNQNNDIFIKDNGSLSISSGRDAVGYGCLNASKAQLGEMVFYTTKGIPNFQSVWVGVPNIKVFESYLRDTLESVSGVVRVVSLSTSYTKNVLSYTATIKTEYGDIATNG